MGIFGKKEPHVHGVGVLEVQIIKGVPYLKGNDRVPLPKGLADALMAMKDGNFGAPTPPDRPHKVEHSALEEMVLKRRGKEFGVAMLPHIKALADEVQKWIPLHRQSNDQLIEKLQQAIHEYAEHDCNADGLSRFEEFALDDFGQKVLGKIKREAGRK